MRHTDIITEAGKADFKRMYSRTAAQMRIHGPRIHGPRIHGLRIHIRPGPERGNAP